MRVRKVLIFALSLCMVTALFAGCGQQEETKTEENKMDYSGITFRVAWWGNDARNEATKKLLKEFAKDYPGLTIEVEYCSSPEYWTKLTTQAAGHDLPDVFQITYTQVCMCADNQQVLELDSLIAEGKIDTTYIDDAFLAGGKVNGVQYAIPTGTNAACYIYNPAVLEAAGVTISKTPTLSEFVEVCQVIYEKTGAKAHNPIYEQLFRSMGGDMWAKDGNALGFDAEMLSMFWTDKLKGLEEGYYLGPGDYKEVNEGSNFQKNIIWCYGGFTNQLASLEEMSGLELEMFCYPIVDNAAVKNATVLTPAMLWSVSRNTENPEIAAAFIDFFTNNIITYEICGTERGTPISSEIREFLNAMDLASEQKVNAFVDFLREGNTMELNLNVPLVSAAVHAVYEELDEYVKYKAVKETDIPALAEECVRRMTEILNAAE